MPWTNLLAQLILLSTASGAATSWLYPNPYGTPSSTALPLTIGFGRASGILSSYTSLMSAYKTGRDGQICFRCLDVYMSLLVYEVYNMERYLDAFTSDEVAAIVPKLLDMNMAIVNVLNSLIDFSGTWSPAPYGRVVGGQIDILGLAYSAGISSLWSSIEPSIQCGSVSALSQGLHVFSLSIASAASAYSADSSYYMLGPNSCIANRTAVSTNITSAAAPTAAVYDGIALAASTASSYVAQSNASNAALAASTSSAFEALSSAIRTAKNAILAHPSLVAGPENIQGFQDAGNGISELLRVIYVLGNSTVYSQYEKLYSSLALELAAWLFVQLKKAETVACSDYRGMASQFLYISSARDGVGTQIFLSDMAPFPTVTYPYSQTCLQTSFVRPTVGWRTEEVWNPKPKKGVSTGAVALAVTGGIIGFGVALTFLIYCCSIRKKYREHLRNLEVERIERNQRIEESGSVVEQLEGQSGPVLRLTLPARDDFVFVVGTCAQCGSDIHSDMAYSTCCEQLFHQTCVGDDTVCLGNSPDCIGRPALPRYEKPPDYDGPRS